jgi:hypothetical protein
MKKLDYTNLNSKSIRQERVEDAIKLATNKTHHILVLILPT